MFERTLRLKGRLNWILLGVSNALGIDEDSQAEDAEETQK